MSTDYSAADALMAAFLFGLPTVLAGLVALNRWEAWRDRRAVRADARRRGRKAAI